jgi:hypothetical protein
MTQNPPKTGEHWRVNLDEPWEVRFWTKEFGCSEPALRAAVAAAGPQAGAVRAHLARRHPSFPHDET